MSANTSMTCPECPYDKARNMGSHLFFVHGYSKTRITNWRTSKRAAALLESGSFDYFRCQFCPKTYKRENSRRAHERNIHCVPAAGIRQKYVPCPLRHCTFVTTSLLDLCAHAKESHASHGDYTIKEARFESMIEFQAWRLQYEEQTQTVLTTESVNNNAAGGTSIRYMRCAQLEAHIRHVRRVMRKMRGDTEETLEELEEEEDGEEDEEEGEGEGDGEREEGKGVKRERTASPPRKQPRRGAVKEEKRGEEGEGREEEREEEEEIDVEQVDTEDEGAGPSTSSGRRRERKERGGERRGKRKLLDSPPRLKRVDGENQMADDDEDFPIEELERRMNTKHCTAHMRVLILRGGIVHVEYCTSHLGHDIEPMTPPRTIERKPKERNQRIKGEERIIVEEEIERAKMRRKGRKETEGRWRKEKRMRNERDEFMKLCNRFDEVGANVELYEVPAEEDEMPHYYDGNVEYEEVEEVIEDEEIGPGEEEEDEKVDLKM